MSERSIEADPVTFEVMRADRRFPMLPDARHSPPRNRIRELQIQPTDETLPGRLSQAISQRLAWHEIPLAQNPDRETVVGAYVNSLKQLAGFQKDIENLVFEVCRANLEFRQGAGETHAEARDAILKAKLDEMTDQAFSGWMPAKNIVSADILSKSPDVYVTQLDASLTNEAGNFSRQLFEMLQRMVDLELFGLVEWLPKQCCRYHFFRRVVIQGAGEHTDTITETMTSDEAGARGFARRVIGNRRTTSTHIIKHEIRFARHQHELINAVRTSIRNSTVIMPPQIVRLVESIPEWLYPFVEVIDGHIVRELIIERDVSALPQRSSNTTQNQNERKSIGWPQYEPQHVPQLRKNRPIRSLRPNDSWPTRSRNRCWKKSPQRSNCRPTKLASPNCNARLEWKA